MGYKYANDNVGAINDGITSAMQQQGYLGAGDAVVGIGVTESGEFVVELRFNDGYEENWATGYILDSFDDAAFYPPDGESDVVERPDGIIGSVEAPALVVKAEDVVGLDERIDRAITQAFTAFTKGFFEELIK